MNNKQKLIKSGAFMVATALVLVVVTVAWYISGSSQTKVAPVGADITTDNFGYTIMEAADTNMNGLLDAAEALNWVAVPGLNLNISNLVPNQYHFYKAVIQSGMKASMQFKFTGIAVTMTDPEATLEDYLSQINVRFRTQDDADPANSMTGGPDRNDSMYALLGDPAAENVIVYDLDLTGYQNRTFTIYYDIGVYQNSAPGAESQGASVSIGAIEFEAN